MVDGDGDQALAAEPGFRRVAPGGVNASLIDLLHLFHAVDRVESDPLRSGQAGLAGVFAPGLVVVYFAGGMALQAAARAAVLDVMQRVYIGSQLGRAPSFGPGQAVAEGPFHFPDAVLDHPLIVRLYYSPNSRAAKFYSM